jgi:hypothetical protein
VKKNILYISYYYPPSNSIGSRRSYSQVSALRAAGHIVKVVHAENNESRYINNPHHTKHDDDISIKLDIDTINSAYNKSSNIKHWIVRVFPRIFTSSLLNIKLLLFGDERNWNTEENFQFVLSLLGEFTPNILISTSGPIENHGFCLKFKRHFQCYWVGEYRDSWSYNPMQPKTDPSDLTSRMLRLKERPFVKDIDLVLAVSPMIKQYYEKYFNKQSYLIFSGWLDSISELPDPEIIIENKTNKLNILHLGSMLLGKRSPMPIIKLFEEHAVLRDAFDLFFIGRDTHLFINQLQKTQHARSVVRLIPEVNFYQARAEGLNADILLLLMMNDDGEKHVVTGKIYEYIYLNKPIIALDSYHSQASMIIEKYNFGFVCRSLSELKDQLIELSLLESLELDSSKARDKFNVVNTMSKLIDHLDQNAFKIIR